MPNYMKKAGIPYQDGGSTNPLKDVPAGKKYNGLRGLAKSVRNKMGYKKGGGSLLSKMTGGSMMDMSLPMEMKMRGDGGGMQSMPAKMPKAGKGKYMKY